LFVFIDSGPGEAAVISGVQKIIVPVDDQDKAKHWWATVLGFEIIRDDSHGDERWVEVTPPDHKVVLVLSPRQAGQRRREESDPLPDSDVFFGCNDIQQTFAELTERGVRFPTPPQEMHFGWWATFEDCDGTRYALSQW
jgi:predicted enzyme related to lactoylglutathione lyase